MTVRRAWGRVHRAKSIGQSAGGRTHGAERMGPRAKGMGHRAKGRGHGAKCRIPSAWRMGHREKGLSVWILEFGFKVRGGSI
jgi:hypothetical protein